MTDFNDRAAQKHADSVGGLLDEEQLARRYFGRRISDSSGMTGRYKVERLTELVLEKADKKSELTRLLSNLSPSQHEIALNLLTDEQLIALDEQIFRDIQKAKDDIFCKTRLRKSVTAAGETRASKNQ